MSSILRDVAHTEHDLGKLRLGDRRLESLLQEGGVAGCGGAGFPTYAKYLKPSSYHLTNAQESEPGYLKDKWLSSKYAHTFTELYGFLLNWGFERILIAPKYKDRNWFLDLEQTTGAVIHDCRKKHRINPGELPDPILFTYTDNQYEFGKEQALIMACCGIRVGGKELPIDRGFVVNNTETLFNVYQVLANGEPVTSKYLHVYGETPAHAFLQVPLGTPAEDLFVAAGTSLSEIQSRGFLVLDGGPGWFSVVDHPASYSVTRRTNALLVADPEYAAAGLEKGDVRAVYGRQGYPRTDGPEPEKEPRPRLHPEQVRIQMIDNPGIKSVRASRPVVQVGQQVARGEVIATPGAGGFSIYQHASINGRITEVRPEWVEIKAT